MHDIDRVRFETSPQAQWETYPMSSGASSQEIFEYQELEYAGESEVADEASGPFQEAEVLELASELLEVNTEQELDRFLGNLVRRAGKAVGSFVRSPAGSAIGGVLKGVAKQVLPSIGSAVGGYLGGSTGADLGSKAAAAAGRLFGLELEGLSGEDQEFEVAKRFVQFGGSAVQQMAAAGSGSNPSAAARQAAIAAARVHAPGLLVSPPNAGAPAGTAARAGADGFTSLNSGRWTRRGNRIVLHGV